MQGSFNMFAKLSAFACAALLVSGGVALAQPSPAAEERHDRAVSLSDDSKIRELSTQIKRDDAKVDQLLHRAGHEQGQQRAADAASAERYKAQAQKERDQVKALNANNRAVTKDSQADRNEKPR
jgi:hypothetical protein